MRSAGTKLDLNQQKWTVVGELRGSDSSGLATVSLVIDASGAEAVAKLIPNVYAFGGIGYSRISGRVPFPGPDVADLFQDKLLTHRREIYVKQ
jgi:hypothetical protein